LTARDGVYAKYGTFKSPSLKLFDVHAKTVSVPLEQPDLVAAFAKEYKTSPFMGSKPSLLRTKPASELIPYRISVGSLYIKYLVELERASIKEAF